MLPFDAFTTSHPLDTKTYLRKVDALEEQLEHYMRKDHVSTFKGPYDL